MHLYGASWKARWGWPMARAMAKPLDRRPLWRRLLPARLRWSWLFVGLGLFGLMASARMLPAMAATHSVLPQAHRLYLHGDLRHTSDDEVLDVVRPYLNVDLVELDIDGLYAAMHALPWVAEAKIRRRWPDGVWVRLAEREAIARWGEEALISPTGEVFSVPAASIPEDLVQLHGPVGTERQLLATYARTRRQLATVDVEIESLWIDARGAWHLRVNNGLELRLGRHELDERVQRFVDVVLGSLAPRLTEAQVIDLRYGNGFAVSWRPQTEEKQADVEKT